MAKRSDLKVFFSILDHYPTPPSWRYIYDSTSGVNISGLKKHALGILGQKWALVGEQWARMNHAEPMPKYKAVRQAVAHRNTLRTIFHKYL
eukprot:1153476-Pelagomonas_calceolata.AAC.2